MDHGILLHKLKAIGISGKVDRWIMNFLLDRRQQIIVNGNKSSVSFLRSGVPQGSVLGPMLFLLFIGDISKEVSASTLVYVDDSKVKDKIHTEEDVSKLQDNLDKIYLWERENNMKFNGDKFQILRYGRNNEIKEDTCYFTGNMEFII